jgi:FtsZ-interacting cell division protein ZipA
MFRPFLAIFREVLGKEKYSSGCVCQMCISTGKMLMLEWLKRIQSTVQHSTAQHSTAQYSTAQHNTAQHSTAQHSTVQYSTAQHSTAQHNTAQHSTAQHSTAQHSTVQYSVYHNSCYLIANIYCRNSSSFSGTSLCLLWFFMSP